MVYAAEIGYEYSGYEYWQTFEAKTAGWQPPWRNRIRSRFEAFAEAYHGAQPEGDWARQFNIIAWPITHGILPQDLQRQLAELLYDASMTFRAETFSSAEALGLHLQSRSSGYSSRFRQFAENVTLLGQIALALLLQDSTEALGGAAGTILHADTLTRIVEDLNRERDARQWLAEARSAARFRVRGLSRISLRDRTTTTAAATNPSRESPHRIGPHSRPRFLLREEAPDRWQVRLQLPNLAQLAAQSPRSGDVLTRTQGRVEGATVPILATGRIVREATPVVTLATWPAPQTQLLSFDGAPPELDAVLRADFRTDAGEFWLFLIGSDGLARELTTRVLRAGASYLLLQRTETRNPVAGLGFRVVRIACTGIFGLRLDIAEDVPDALVDVLAIFGLEVAQTLEVWPAGLPAPEWSGDGAAEWVAGHPIVLGVRTDHRFTRLTLTIDGVRQPDVDAAADAPLGSPVFVQLPSLRPGPHQITVAAHTAGQPQEPAKPVSGAGTALSGLRGELSCFIREPRTLAAGQAGALSFAVLPSAPSLEDVWEDRIEIHAAAPGVTSLRGRVVFRGSSGQELFNRPLALPSPCDTAAWRREFKAVRRAAEAEYDAAQVCVLEFSAEALGRGRVTAERDFTPLRWAVLANGHRAVLVDSQGCTDLTVCTVACATPSLELPVEAAAALEGIVVSDGGALIVARSGRLEAATVVVPPQRVTGGFAALAGERPNVPPTNREPSAIAALARAAALWERARLAGSSLAEHRRGLAVEALVGRIMSAVGGGRWITAEEAVRGEGLQSAAEVMRQLIAHRPNERAVGVLLAERVASTAEATVAEAERVLLGALAPFVHVQGLAELATYGLRLAASPVQARTLVEGAADPIGPPDARERTLINGLLACPIILRAARYFVIATRALHDAQGRDHRALPWES
ncbi:MAG TPA: hypothetical protein VFS33_07250 [Gemmatimonadales bacterium]|nr:hypothetical protein [Gemmatimonadales bacterium]